MTTELPPLEVVAAAELVGRYFAERNVKHWQLGPCASRAAHDELVEALRSLETAATKAAGATDPLSIEVSLHGLFGPARAARAVLAKAEGR